MKIKVVGFKVGVSRPIANRTIQGQERIGSLHIDKQLQADGFVNVYDRQVGKIIRLILDKSDFISIRRVND